MLDFNAAADSTAADPHAEREPMRAVRRAPLRHRPGGRGDEGSAP